MLARVARKHEAHHRQWMPAESCSAPPPVAPNSAHLPTTLRRYVASSLRRCLPSPATWPLAVASAAGKVLITKVPN